MAEIIDGERYLTSMECWFTYGIHSPELKTIQEAGGLRTVGRLNGRRYHEGDLRHFLDNFMEAMQIPIFYRSRKKWLAVWGIPEELRREMAAFKLEGYISPTPVDLYTWGYSDTFNHEFRERVRNFFGRQCVECGARENGLRLVVHHVNTRPKDDCADPAALFVALCPPCHHRCHGRPENREHWRRHFEKIIRDRWGGRCYLPTEVVPV